MSKVKMPCLPECRYLRNTNSSPTPKGWYCVKGDEADLAHDGYGAALRRDKGCEYERGEK